MSITNLEKNFPASKIYFQSYKLEQPCKVSILFYNASLNLLR